MVGAGVLGYAMRGLGYNPAPLVWASAPAAIMLAATAVVLLAPAARAGLRLWTRGRARLE